MYIVVYFPQSLFPPLCTGKIFILEETLVGFCGQFGGGDMKDGIFVFAYKCREVWAQLVRPPSDRYHKPGFQGFIEKRISEVTVHGQAQSSYHSYRFVCMWIVQWYSILVQFTQVYLAMPPPPHYTGPARIPVTPVSPESGFATPGPFPCPWLHRRALRSSSCWDVALCKQNLLKSI